MANRRMFSLDIVDTDVFLDMPMSAQCLYFHLGMRADDDGFVGSPKKVIGITGCRMDDMKLLIAKHFVIPFESGVVVIADWKINNYLRPDRYKHTRYTKEYQQLTCIDGNYHLDTVGIPSDIPTVDPGKVRIGKDNIYSNNINIIAYSEQKEEQGIKKITDKCPDNHPPEIEREKEIDIKIDIEKEREKESEKGKKIDYQLIADMYNNTCVSFPRLTKLSDARKKSIKARLRTYSIDDFQKLFIMAEESSFLKGENQRNWSATFDWLVKDSNMAKVLDGNYSNSQSRRVTKASSCMETAEYDRPYMKMYEDLPMPAEDPFS